MHRDWLRDQSRNQLSWHGRPQVALFDLLRDILEQVLVVFKSHGGGCFQPVGGRVLQYVRVDCGIILHIPHEIPTAWIPQISDVWRLTTSRESAG
jgi:hypothetical protein